MAALELAAEIGYGRLTIEGIAARAGVGKQTIYRWWPSKADILLEAGAAKAELRVPVTDRGSYRADLRAFLEASYEMAGYPGLADLLRALMAEAQVDREFGDRFRAAFLERRREALAVIIDRARERGDLPARPAPAIVADIVFGTIWYRILATRRPLDADLVDDLIGLLAPTPAQGLPRRRCGGLRTWPAPGPAANPPALRSDPGLGPGDDAPSPSSPRAPSRTDSELIVGSSGHGVPPPTHADACGRKTPPPTAHDRGAGSGRAVRIPHRRPKTPGSHHENTDWSRRRSQATHRLPS